MFALPVRAAFLAAVVLSLTACDGSPAYWGAIPTPALVEVPHPAPIAPGGPFAVGDAVNRVGYISTPALALVDEVTRYATPRDTGRGLEWRSTPGASEALAWRVVLTGAAGDWGNPAVWTGARTPALSWRWRLEGKPKMLGDDAFRELASGTRETSEGDDAAALGSGTLVVDWDAVADLLPLTRWARNTGRLDLSFEVTPEARTVDAQVTLHPLASAGTVHTYGKSVFTHKGEARADGTGRLASRSHYSSAADPAGSWMAEDSRWVASGAGRTESRSGVGFPDAPYTVSGSSSVCWDISLTSVYSGSKNGEAWTETGDPGLCVLPVANAWKP